MENRDTGIVGHLFAPIFEEDGVDKVCIGGQTIVVYEFSPSPQIEPLTIVQLHGLFYTVGVLPQDALLLEYSRQLADFEAIIQNRATEVSSLMEELQDASNRLGIAEGVIMELEQRLEVQNKEQREEIAAKDSELQSALAALSVLEDHSKQLRKHVETLETEREEAKQEMFRKQASKEEEEEEGRGQSFRIEQRRSLSLLLDARRGKAIGKVEALISDLQSWKECFQEVAATAEEEIYHDLDLFEWAVPGREYSPRDAISPSLFSSSSASSSSSFSRASSCSSMKSTSFGLNSPKGQCSSPSYSRSSKGSLQMQHHRHHNSSKAGIVVSSSSSEVRSRSQPILT